MPEKLRASWAIFPLAMSFAVKTKPSPSELSAIYNLPRQHRTERNGESKRLDSPSLRAAPGLPDGIGLFLPPLLGALAVVLGFVPLHRQHIGAGEAVPAAVCPVPAELADDFPHLLELLHLEEVVRQLFGLSSLSARALSPLCLAPVPAFFGSKKACV